MAGRDDRYKEVIKTLDRHAGGGKVKAVQLTVFFDANGHCIGKSEAREVVLYPASLLSDLVDALNHAPRFPFSAIDKTNGYHVE